MLNYLNADGSFEYVPYPSFAGTDSFSYVANDGTDDSATATVTISVDSVSNDPGDDIYSAQQVSLTPNVPTELQQHIGDGMYGYADVDFFKVTLSAGDTISVDVDAEYLDDGTPYSSLDSHLRLFNASGFDIANNGDGLSGNDYEFTVYDSYLSFTTAAGGDFYIGVSAAGNEYYDPLGTPGMGYGYSLGDYVLQLLVTDGGGGNQAPIAYDDHYTIDQDSTLVVSAAGVLANDLDSDGDALTAVLQSAPVNGSLSYLSSDGSFEYVPSPGFSGSDSFTYVANDGSDNSNVATVDITIIGNDAPVGDPPGDVFEDAKYVSVAPGNAWTYSEQIGNGLYGDRDVDFYELSLSAGWRVTVDVDAWQLDADGSQLSELDSYLRVFKSNGQELAANDDGFSTNDYGYWDDGFGESNVAHTEYNEMADRDAFVSFTAPESGIYYIGVSAADNATYSPQYYGSDRHAGGTGAYELEITVEYAQPSIGVQVAVDDVTVEEGSQAIFTVTLAQPRAEDTVLLYRTRGGTAKPHVDYGPVSGTLLIPAGQTEQTVAINTVWDTEWEATETFNIEVTGPADVFATATARILDDAGQQNGGRTYQQDPSGPWSWYSSNRYITVENVEVTEGGQARFEVQFNGYFWQEPFNDQEFTVAYQTRDRTATAGSDYLAQSGSVTFLPGGNDENGVYRYPDRVKVVAIDTVKDWYTEKDEQFYVDFTTPWGDQPVVVATIRDAGSPRVRFHDVTVLEGNAAEFRVRISEAQTQPVTVNYVASEGSAKHGSDVNLTSATGLMSGSVTIEPGATSATISFDTYSDWQKESEEFFYVEISMPWGYHTVAEGRILDDRSDIPKVTLDAIAPVLEGEDVIVNLTLDRTRDASITVTVSTMDGSATGCEGGYCEDFQSTWEQVTFAPGETSKTVTIPTFEDWKREGTEQFFVELQTPWRDYDVKTATMAEDDPDLSELDLMDYGDEVQYALTVWHDSFHNWSSLSVLSNDHETEVDYFESSDANYYGYSASGSDTLRAVLFNQPAHGHVELFPNGQFNYIPKPRFVGEDSFRYAAFDGAATSDPAMVRIKVANDIPDAHDDPFDGESCPECIGGVGYSVWTHAATGPQAYYYGDDDAKGYYVWNDDRPGIHDLVVDGVGVLHNDADQDFLTAELATCAGHGRVELASDGSFKYYAWPGFAGDDSFTYRVTDGVVTQTKTVRLSVHRQEGYTYNDQYFYFQEAVPSEHWLGGFGLDSDASGHWWCTLNAGYEHTGAEPVLGVEVTDLLDTDADVAVFEDWSPTAAWSVRPGYGPYQETYYDPWWNSNCENCVWYGWNWSADESSGQGDYEWNEGSQRWVWFGQEYSSLGSVHRWVRDDEWWDAYSDVWENNTRLPSSTTLPAGLTWDAGSWIVDESLFTPISTTELSWWTYGNQQWYRGADGEALLRLNGTLAEIYDGDRFVFNSASDTFTYEDVEFDRLQNGDLVHDRTLSGNLLNYASDGDNDPLQVALTSMALHGSLTLNDDGTFKYVPAPRFVGDDSFTFIVRDGVFRSDEATVNITVTNQIPVANDDLNYKIGHDRVLTVAGHGVIGNDRDDDFDPLTATLITPTFHGHLLFNEDGTFEYRPFEGFFGTDEFVYRISDGIADSLQDATVKIEVTQTPPTASNVNLRQPHDQTLIGSLVSSAFDADGDELTWRLESDLAAGTGMLRFHSDGKFAYSPPPAFEGTATFTYSVADVLERSETKTVTIEVTQDAPQANNDEFSVAHDRILGPVGVLANDHDVDTTSTMIEPLTARVMVGVEHGTLAFNSDGNFSYQPDEGYFGEDSFTYIANDGRADSNEATVTIHVLQTAPVSQPDAYTTSHGRTTAQNLLANDFDGENDVLTVELLHPDTLLPVSAEDLNLPGDFELLSNGAFTFIPDGDWADVEIRFAYRASDGIDTGEPQQVLIQYVQSAPVAVHDLNNKVTHDRTLVSEVFIGCVGFGGGFGFGYGYSSICASNHGVLLNDRDDDGDQLTAVLFAAHEQSNTTAEALGLLGELIWNEDDNGMFTYTPPAAWIGVEEFYYRAFDGWEYSEPALVRIEVVQQGAPEARDDKFVLIHDRSLSGNVALNDRDPDNDLMIPSLVDPDSGDVLTPAELGLQGTLTWDSGSFTYTPPEGWWGQETFYYQVSDGLDVSEPAMVTLDVLERAPVATDDNYRVKVNGSLHTPGIFHRWRPSVLANDYDPDNGPLTIHSNGFFNTYGPGMLETRPPALNDSFEISWASVEIGEPTARTDHGTIHLHADGSFLYTPDPDFRGIDGFFYRLHDGLLESDIARVMLVVDNRVPMAIDDVVDVELGAALDKSVVFNDSDADNDILTAILIDPATGAEISADDLDLSGDFLWNPHGAFSFYPHDDFEQATFSYKLSDVFEESEIATVTLRLAQPDAATLSNEPPVGGDDSYAVGPGHVLEVPQRFGWRGDLETIPLIFNDRDPNGDPLIFVTVPNAGPANGTLNLNEDGSFSYTPDPSIVTGSGSFQYQLDAAEKGAG